MSADYAPVPYVSHQAQAPRRRQWRIRADALTTQDCADALGCSRRTVIRHIEDGLLAAIVVKRPGRSYIRIEAEALREFVRDDSPRLREKVDRWLMFHTKQGQ